MMNVIANLWQFEFFQHAIYAGVIISILASFVGYFVIVKNLNFTSHALSHIGISGASIALLLGFPALLGQSAITILSALLMLFFNKKNVKHNDVTTSLLLSFILGIAALTFFLNKNYANQANIIIFGNIFSINYQEFLVISLTALFSILAIILINRQLLLISINQNLAESRGINVNLINSIFMITLALAITFTSQIVGVLLIFTLIIGSSAIAMLYTKNYLPCLFLSIILNIIIITVSIIAAALLDWPINFCASSLVIALYSLSYLLV